LEQQERWQLAGSAVERYERYKVPRNHAPVARLLLERVALRPGQRVLDVACGTGIVARLAAPCVAPSGSVVGLDLNEEMLTVARACAAEAGLAIDWRQGDAGELPFDKGAFDAVFCQQGLQFFRDKAGALREMRRVVVAEGAVALSVFVASAYNVALSEALARYAGATVAARCMAPFALGDRALLTAIVSDAGFGEIDIQTAAFTSCVEPTQAWLLQDTDSTPYGNDIARLDPAARAAMMREIAAKLAGFWNVECFSVPREVHLVYARR